MGSAVFSAKLSCTPNVPQKFKITRETSKHIKVALAETLLLVLLGFQRVRDLSVLIW